jgi:hypothetical protein
MNGVIATPITAPVIAVHPANLGERIIAGALDMFTPTVVADSFIKTDELQHLLGDRNSRT